MCFPFLLFLFTRVLFSKIKSHDKPQIQENSNSDFIGKNLAIHLNDYSTDDITNSKFTDDDIPSGENYFFSFQRDINFDNVEFSFSQAKIGAIKVEYPGKISIKNSVFRKCFVDNGIGNAIYISTKNSSINTEEEVEESILVMIENNFFESCGNSGYVIFIESRHALMQNNTFDFSQNENSCGAFRITCCGNITIIDNHFINTRARGTILYEPESVATEEDFLIIQNCTFNECDGTCCYFSVQSGSKEKITVSECIFSSCKKGSDDSIALGSNNLADSISLFVSKNEFIQCGSNEENVFVVKLQTNNRIYGTLVFENNVFDNSCGALSIKQNDGIVNVRNCIFKNLIHGPIDFQSLNYLLFEDCFFDECQGSFEVKENIKEAEIQGCVFSDCINTDYVAESVILISNPRCILNNNTVNFTSNEASKSRSGLHIKSHGNINVTNNLFIKIRFTKYSSICINDEVSSDSSLADAIVRFNYNTIENVGNVKTGIFIIDKHYPFSIDHNIIKECVITHYSTQITIYSQELVITNLTFKDCQAASATGGAIGLWLSFPDKTGKLTLLDCHFEHNSAIIDSHTGDGCQPSGNGGAFAVGDASIENIEFIADNCTFVDNHAANYGGALSIQSTLAATIKNCTFTNNQADQGGGAIYISPTKFIEPGKENQHTPLPSCTILGCKFELNNDISNKGHAIYFEFANDCTTIIKIDECEFADNYNSESTSTPGGFTISCDSPTLNITNTKIEFTNPSFSTTGLKVEEHTETLTIQECELKEITENPSCILSSNSITIDGLNINSQESTETAIQILKSNIISIKKLNVEGQIELAIELYNLLPTDQSLQFDISDSSFQNSGDGIKFIDSFTSIHTLNLVSTFAKNSLISYSPTSNMNELLIHHLNFQGCTANEGSLINVDGQIETINISYSEFESCRGKVFTISSPNLIVDNCSFKSHTITSDGCLRIESITKAQILNCNFSSTTKMYNKEFKGGAIYVASDTSTSEPEVIIRDSTFHITRNLKEGNSIYVEGYKVRLVVEGCQFSEIQFTEYQFAIVTETQNLQMSDVTFNCDLPLLFKNIDRVHDIEFTDITCNRSPILIVPQDDTYTIDNVRFHNCKCTNYVIRVDTDHFQILNSVIEFDESSAAKSCKGIDVNKLGDHNIINTQFIKTNNHAIYYYQSKDAFQDKLLNITGCTFDACNEPGATCTIELGITQVFEFKENIFQNIQSGSFTCTITFDHFDEITFDSCHFINNSMNNNDYGGSGLRILHRKNAQIHLFFNNCQWINNSNLNNEYGGGAFSPGHIVSFSPELTFTQCIFKENKAKYGGALSVQTMYPLHISGCTFEDNKATESSQNGGAIYLGPKNPTNPIEICEITGSTFIGNSAASGKGHVIFVDSGLTTDVIIDSSNNFTNNNNDGGSGSAIYFNGKSALHITFPTFSDEKLSRFIEFGEGCEATLDDVAFRGCQEKDGDGNAVKIGLNSKSVTLRSCTFTNCGTKGYVVRDVDGASIFEDCSFVFDGQTACCALDITTNKAVTVVGCTFNKNNNGYDASSNHGTLYYHPENPTTKATFTSCSFIQCSGNTNIAFSIRTSIEPEFSFITVNDTGSEDSPSTNYIGEVYLTSETSFNPEFCSINNNVASTDFGGGCAILVKSESDSTFILTYRSCQWTNNHAVYSKDVGNNRYNGVGGAYQHGFDSSSTNVLLEFNNCTFLDNKSDREGGALAIQVVKNVLITKCYFKGNRAGIKVQSSSLNLLDLPCGAGYGGALYIDSDFSQDDPPKLQFQIEESVFYGNEAVNGHAIYIRGGVETQLLIQSGNVLTDNGKSGSTIVSECNELSTDPGVIFNFTDPTSSSRPYEFGPGSAAKYENLVFEDVSVSNDDKEGNVINIADGVLSAFISNCTFRNCGHKGYVVTCYEEIDIFEFYNCTITFDDPSSAIKGLGIFSPPNTRLMIEDCHFQRCKEGCIIVEPKNKESQSYEDLDIKNVTFDESYGTSNRAFLINWAINHLKMDNIHVINSPQGGYICVFYFRISTSTANFTFSNWEFNNNTANSLFGGGSGMWITDEEKKSKLEIAFENCVWSKNHAVISHRKDDFDVDNRKYYNGLGGAFQIGFSQTIANTKLEFTGCTFESNTADCDGGALAIQTTDDCTIKHCLFKKNIAGAGNYDEAFNYGGAIFIEPDFKNDLAETTLKPTSTIENCTFESNVAVNNAHAISLTGDYAKIEINNATFIDNGANSGSTLYSICPRLTFEKVKFIRTNDEAPSTRAIEINAMAEITLDDALFDSCKVIDRDGGAILLSNSNESTANIDSKSIEKQEYSITNCKFVNCQARNGGSIFISEGVNSVSILNTEFKGGKVDNEGVAIYISSQVDEFRIDSSVKFVEQNDNGKFLISSYCSKFDISDLEIQNGQFGSGIKGIKLNAGIVTINNIFFNKCISALEIKINVQEATINDCIFSDCYWGKQDGKQGSGQVVLVENTQCTFSNNILNFSNNINAITGIYFRSHGYITIENNKFINMRSSDQLSSTLCIDESRVSSFNDATLRFNYNLIQNTAKDGNYPFFYLTKTQQFNIDHNIFKDCKSEWHSININVTDNANFGKSLVLTNLTFENCESISMTGGSIELRLTFTNREGSLTFQGCSFISGKATIKSSNEGGNGGGLGMSLNSIDKTAITIENCKFINNTADNYGGGIYLANSKPTVIIDSTFEGNQAGLGGGALYICQEIIICEIHGCIFTNNTAANNKGGALYIGPLRSSSSNICEIHGCIFKNNTADNEGGAIATQNLEDCIIENSTFTDNVAGKLGNILRITESKIEIKNCTFENKKAILNERSSLYFNVFYDVNINDCNFTDCGVSEEGSVIYLIGDRISISKNIIEFTQESSSSCGIEINSFSEIELTNNTFICCHSNSFGGGLRINKNLDNFYSTIHPLEKLIFERCNAKRGSAIYLNETTVIDLEIINCTFNKNKAFQHGGAILIENIESLNIKDCLFEENSANNRHLSSTEAELLSEKLEGRGGAIFINPSSLNSNENTKTDQIVIENCTFLSNSAYDGYGIYIEGYGRGESITIKDNKFHDNQKLVIDKEENDIYRLYRSIISSEIINLYSGKVITENSFNNNNDDELNIMNILMYVDHYGNPILPTKGPSDHLSKSFYFSISDKFTKSDTFSKSDIFTKSDTLTKSDTFTDSNTIEITPCRSSSSVHSYSTQIFTVSNSVSLTYVIRKSISYSASYFASNTISLIYNEQDNTYVIINTETNYMSFFPYIIRYLSPSYVPTFVQLVVLKNKSITKEQLIGVTCGGASVFFLVLGIIILVIKRRNENKQFFDEFDDISYSIDEINEKREDENEYMPQESQYDNSESTDTYSYYKRNYSELFI